MNLQKEVSIVGSPGADISDTNLRSHIREGNRPRIEGIHKRQVILGGESWGSLVVSREFSLPIKLILS